MGLLGPDLAGVFKMFFLVSVCYGGIGKPVERAILFLGMRWREENGKDAVSG